MLIKDADYHDLAHCTREYYKDLLVRKRSLRRILDEIHNDYEFVVLRIRAMESKFKTGG